MTDSSLFQGSILEQVLEHVSECHSICRQIGIRTNDPADPTTSILAMYEYEAKHGLGRSDSDSILERLSVQPNPDPKTFEAIAGESGQCLDELFMSCCVQLWQCRDLKRGVAQLQRL